MKTLILESTVEIPQGRSRNNQFIVLCFLSLNCFVALLFLAFLWLVNLGGTNYGVLPFSKNALLREEIDKIEVF